ncbi:MAG: twin-arginine translocase subunit TatC, partial [Cyanobacteria bacterium J06636_27]
MSRSSETETSTTKGFDVENTSQEEFLSELPGEVEMSLFDHLEELRSRIFYSLIAVVLSAISCFIFVKQLVQVLEIPAQG